MYVRKFEADSLDLALKMIKAELGPDAIILKTVTNKGLKGAFKKKKIEITAAISEKNYTKKAMVDDVLDDNQKNQFYQNPAGHISNLINDYSETPSSRKKVSGGYGNLGLNKQAKTNRTLEKSAGGGLDSFLESAPAEVEEKQETYSSKPVSDDEFKELMGNMSPIRDEVTAPKEEASVSNEKIDALEKKIFELSRALERVEKKEPHGIYELRGTLRSLDIAENFIQNLMKKAFFELSEDELEDADTVFEFALREMMGLVKIKMPLFSSSEDEKTITVLVSENSSGQTAMVTKLAALKGNAMIIEFGEETKSALFQRGTPLANNAFEIKREQANTVAELVSFARKGLEENKDVFIDYRSNPHEVNETKNFVDGLNRAFSSVDVLLNISAIHSEMYNKKMINTYRKLCSGMTISHLDLCLNYGALFNLAQGYENMPYVFYGTGPIIPEDIESATAERILAGIFTL